MDRLLVPNPLDRARGVLGTLLLVTFRPQVIIIR